jgi:poly(3-hydroxybutyrate) depolymerase
MNRNYQLYIPANYDKAKPYRLFVMGHGCNGNNAPFKMESVAGDQAILVALKSVDSCFVYNMQGEGAYFDQVVKEVTNDTCVDTNRVFLSGFSSGAWLANMFGCTRANQIRAQGNVAGGLAGGLPACQGPIAALMIHDDKDMMFPRKNGQ